MRAARTGRVLVCGGRDFADARLMAAELARLHWLRGITCVIHGAAKGADRLAADWATGMGISTEAYPADWNAYGRRAGPLRNARMLVEGRPDLVVGFPGGRGTADMLRRAREAGVEVIEVTA